MKRATIYDVAREAGVSHQTVSLILKGREGFKPETRDRVMAALKLLDYRPNHAAWSLATNRSMRIGALVGALLEVGPLRTVQGAADRAREAGYLLDVVSVDPDDAAAVDAALDELRRQNLAGLLVLAPVDRLSHRLEGLSLGSPLIVEAVDDVLNPVGLGLLIDHLVALGHRRFAHLAGPSDWAASGDRECAYREALARHGLDSVTTVVGDWSARSGHAAASALDLESADAPTALVVANDQMALGALLALSERGIDVPGRVSVTGFDDTPESPFYTPPLTTVRADYAAHGRGLVERLLRQIDPARVGDEQVAEPPTLQVRASTGAPRN
ncbi:LacI family transcriptional regulator [Salinibacterium sp. SYSU T00001]|uniref:LacI family DNA-binding transcriptional regulator n=1 Tax=Homoserinimonas sedimenticola TaxID=2986805 RepID=UPI0022362F77|nr:LacI family DNA-binding transcriptional regulator [Salinibacterium sedimenticola]MCW4385205.1 LacI family transcriptional regulator [Salinibacterium sedimenticola]